MKLYRISSVHWSGKEGRKTDEFVVADHMTDVIKYCQLDLQDRGLEITALAEEVPITKILVSAHKENQ